MQQVFELAFDIRVRRKKKHIPSHGQTVHLSWLVSRVASSRVSRISKQKLPNTLQFWAITSRKSQIFSNHGWYVTITTFNMLWHHFLRHSPVRRSPWAWLREHVCPGGERSAGEHCHDVSCEPQTNAVLLTATCSKWKLPTKCGKNTSYVCWMMYWSACGGSMVFRVPNRQTYTLP